MLANTADASRRSFGMSMRPRPALGSEPRKTFSAQLRFGTRSSSW